MTRHMYQTPTEVHDVSMDTDNHLTSPPLTQQEDTAKTTNSSQVESWIAELQHPADKALQLEYTTSSIFVAPANSIIIHACNTKGIWGSGIALALRQRYPTQYRIYRDHCSDYFSDQLLGTSLLIAPSLLQVISSSQRAPTLRDKHWIGCLFVNDDIGRDSSTQLQRQPDIIANTKRAMLDLVHHIAYAQSVGLQVGDIHMPQINSGAFRIPWHHTVNALEDVSRAQDCLSGALRVHVHRFEYSTTYR